MMQSINEKFDLHTPLRSDALDLHTGSAGLGAITVRDVYAAVDHHLDTHVVDALVGIFDKYEDQELLRGTL